MKVTADLQAGVLFVDGAKMVNISNAIRTLREGTRHSSEVVRSITPGSVRGYPYDPHHFPKGLWRITGIEWQKDYGFQYNTYGPVKIRTDAWQMVNVWELDADGDYLRETERQVKDTGYLLHSTASETTLAVTGKGIEDASRELSREIRGIGSGIGGLESAISAGQGSAEEIGGIIRAVRGRLVDADFVERWRDSRAAGEPGGGETDGPENP